MYNEVSINDLIGKTLVSIEGTEGEDRLIFKTNIGAEYLMYHDQDCCESVYLEDVTGDLSDLIGSPILQAEESTSETDPEDVEIEYHDYSYLWTFYRLATNKGSVVLRWYGSSNGYYGVSVNFKKINSGE